MNLNPVRILIVSSLLFLYKLGNMTGWTPDAIRSFIEPTPKNGLWLDDVFIIGMLGLVAVTIAFSSKKESLARADLALLSLSGLLLVISLVFKLMV